MSVETDPKVVHAIAQTAMKRGLRQCRNVAVSAAIYDSSAVALGEEVFNAYRKAVTAEYDRLVAASLLQEEDVCTVRAVVDAAGALPIPQFESMPKLAAALNALLEQFEDRIKVVDEAESLAKVRAYKAKLDMQVGGQD